jgi:hypothetical protein
MHPSDRYAHGPAEALAAAGDQHQSVVGDQREQAFQRRRVSAAVQEIVHRLGGEAGRVDDGQAFGRGPDPAGA